MKLDIYQYFHALDFITDYYKNKKINSDSSLRKWSSEMGFTSPNYMIDLLKKKRPLKLKYADMLSRGLCLEGAEKVYFKTLIQMQNANDDEKIYFNEILNILRPKDTFVNKEEGVFSHWLNVIIFTLSQMDGYPISPKEIQTSLKDKVSLKTIEDSLNLLVKNQLLELTIDGKYKNCHQNFITTINDVPTKAVHSYYSQVISKSHSAVEMDISEREFQCFAIGMKKENLNKIKEVMRRARKEISTFSDDQGDHVYQFNLNGFPMAVIKKDEQMLS